MWCAVAEPSACGRGNAVMFDQGHAVCLIINVVVLQGLNNMSLAVVEFKNVLHQDNMCVEAIACIATHHFYSDQPELALNYFR